MAKLVDALASGASERKLMEARVLFWAPCLLQGVFRQTLYISPGKGCRSDENSFAPEEFAGRTLLWQPGCV